MSTPSTGAPTPLAGVRVLDFTRYLAGPYCTMLLGDLGADVIKIERFPGGDDTRALEPKVGGESVVFAGMNRHKRSVGLDLSKPAGVGIAERLAGDVDVVVESFRPGVAARLGIDYERLSAINPALVYCSITGFGQTGPYSARPGFDIIAQGMAGFLRMTGEPGGRPVKIGFAVNDVAAGMTATYAILAAYIECLRSGTGQYIDVSLLESGLAWTSMEAATYWASGALPEPTGTRHRHIAPYQAYRTADGFVTVGANNPKLWEQFCRDVVERPEWLGDERYSTIADRLANVDDLERDIEEVLTTRATRHWVDRMDACGVPGGEVYRYDETLADPHVRARGMVQSVEHPTMGTTNVLGFAPKLGKTPLEVRRPAPMLGQHTVEVLEEAGCTRAEIDAWLAEGVIAPAGPLAREEVPDA